MEEEKSCVSKDMRVEMMTDMIFLGELFHACMSVNQVNYVFACKCHPEMFKIAYFSY